MFTPENLKTIKEQTEYIRNAEEWHAQCKAKSVDDISCADDALLSVTDMFEELGLEIDTST